MLEASVSKKSVTNFVLFSKLAGVTQPAPRDQPAIFGGSKRFWPRLAIAFPVDCQSFGKYPVVRMVPMTKSTGDLTIVPRVCLAQNDGVENNSAKRTGISKFDCRKALEIWASSDWFRSVSET